MDSANNTQEVDIIEIYPIDSLASTSIGESIQPLSEVVNYSEQYFASSEKLVTLATHAVENIEKNRLKIKNPTIERTV